MEFTNNGFIRCEKCNAPLSRSSLWRHQQTPGCRAAALSERLRDDGWVVAQYHQYPSIYSKQPIRTWPPPFEQSTRHIAPYPTNHIRGGWGRASRTTMQWYMRKTFQDLYDSPQITQDELVLCGLLDENDPQYQSFWTLTQLTKSGESTYD